jgi:hypothetical protein
LFLPCAILTRMRDEKFEHIAPSFHYRELMLRQTYVAIAPAFTFSPHSNTLRVQLSIGLLSASAVTPLPERRKCLYCALVSIM